MRPSVHRGKPVAEFPHHHVEQGRVGLADGDSNGFCGHLALRHEFVDGLDDFVHMFVLKKPDDSGFDCIS